MISARDAAGATTAKNWFSSRWLAVGVLAAALIAPDVGAGQVSISEGGTPSFDFPLAVPPGIAGMAPNLGLHYSASNVNGPVGYGWSIQGISTITRCQGNRLIDGYARPVDFTSNDKLCLDGQRLIQTDASGAVFNEGIANPGLTNPFQQGDSLGGSGLVREYRTSKDSYSRIRAYGSYGGNPSNGPAYFRVWTKSGQIYEYGVNANATANAQINVQGQAVLAAWPVSRISDTVGNYMDFQYEQRDVAWGSAIGGSVIPGHEWNLLEIRYTGNAAQAPANRVVFEYVDRADNPGAAQDRAEAYHQGSKNVSVRLLSKVRTYVNWPGNPIQVKLVKLSYDHGPVTNRSRVQQITECSGANEASCFSPTVFAYADGGGDRYTLNSLFKNGPLATLPMSSATGTYGALAGNFFGNGRTDILRWSNIPSENQIYRSEGDGRFTGIGPGTGAGQFNITDQNLFKNDGCYAAFVGDFNGDGIADILRVMQPTSTASTSCGTIRNILYLSNGDGSFRATDVGGIDFTQKEGKASDHYNCLTPRSAGYVTNCLEPGDTYVGTVQTQGNNFFLMDVNNDGLLDIVTTQLASFSQRLNPPNDATSCATIICTRVFLGQVNGTFVETATNLAHRSVYATPKQASAAQYVADVNGDGLTDLYVDTGLWISRGDGNFDTDPAAPLYPTRCSLRMDFNGDGRADCLFPWSSAIDQKLIIADGTYTQKTASNFSLALTGQPLWGVVQVGDVNGDGRSDIIRWDDNPALNTVFLSNGDGTFRNSTTFNLTTGNDQLGKTDSSASLVLADFTGRGNTEILRLRTSPNNSSDALSNVLYVKLDATPPDQLLSVVSSTGIRTVLTWVPISNPASGSLGSRYTSDRGTPNASAYPAFDLTLPMYVVATATSDTGVSGGTISTEYSYGGLKAANDGRGWLGFRETLRQNAAPDGSNLTVYTSYLRKADYVGLAGLTETRLGALNATGAPVISRSTYVYCDKTAAAGAEASATSIAPCTSVAKVKRPYLYKSIDEGWDLGSAVLPKVTTINTFNNSGDPTQIVATSDGNALGLVQTFSKTTSNQYLADNSAGDNWILGRLQRATVASSVPNSLPNVATSAGSAPSAGATQGQLLSATIVPAALTVNAPGPGVASGTLTAQTGGGGAPYSYTWVRTTGSRTTATTSNAAVAVITATLAAPDLVSNETWQVTVRDVTGATVTASATISFTAPPPPPALVLSACSSVSPATSPAAASTRCTLSNNGQTATASISYSGIAGASVAGPTGACGIGAVCGTVTVTTSSAAGNYVGTLTATPNAGSAASVGINLTVYPAPPPALAYSGCSSATPTTAPTSATFSCTLNNIGLTATSSISYSGIAGASVAGPTGVCGIGAVCGTVTVTSSNVPGSYGGTLTATPNVGSSGSTGIALTVIPGATTIANSPTGYGFGSIGKGSGASTNITFTNVGPYLAYGMTSTVSVVSGNAGSFDAAGGSCSTSLPSGASCTVTVAYSATCTGGGVTGKVTMTGTNFTAVTTTLNASTKSTGGCL